MLTTTCSFVCPATTAPSANRPQSRASRLVENSGGYLVETQTRIDTGRGDIVDVTAGAPAGARADARRRQHESLRHDGAWRDDGTRNDGRNVAAPNLPAGRQP